MHRVHCVHPLANPAAQSVLEGPHVLHELVDVFAKVLAHGPGLDVRMQGSAAARFHFPASGKQGSVGPEDDDGSSDAVGTPFLWNLESFRASGLRNTVRTHAEHEKVEETNEELEHDRLTYRVVYKAQPHFHVGRNVSSFLLQIYRHALDKKQRDVSRVS